MKVYTNSDTTFLNDNVVNVITITKNNHLVLTDDKMADFGFCQNDIIVFNPVDKMAECENSNVGFYVYKTNGIIFCRFIEFFAETRQAILYIKRNKVFIKLKSIEIENLNLLGKVSFCIKREV